jgi:hypothetical protein
MAISRPDILMRWANEIAFAYCRLDLAPPSARQFTFGVAPIAYSPVLLLMPFTFHLTADTLPSCDHKLWLQVQLLCIRLSPSCPFN